MRRSLFWLTLGTVPGTALAHVSDSPLLQHALEHGWAGLVLLPLLFLLLPLRRERR